MGRGLGILRQGKWDREVVIGEAGKIDPGRYRPSPREQTFRRAAPAFVRAGPILAGIIQEIANRVEKMNRRKKIKQLLKAHAKKASAKLAPPSKSKYISKADRLKLAAESAEGAIISSEG